MKSRLLNCKKDNSNNSIQPAPPCRWRRLISKVRHIIIPNKTKKSTKENRPMKMERFFPILIMPNIAMAKGGGGIILFVIFLPIIIWAFIRIWKFWFHLIFSGNSQTSTQPQSSNEPSVGATKECPECAETILVKAKKCKHCGSAVA